MSEMFNNYTNIPSSYIPNNIKKTLLTTNINPGRPLEELDANGNVIGYTWSCGDSVILAFNITGTVQYSDNATSVDAETYLKGKQLQFNLYNARYEIVYTTTVDASTTPAFVIDRELSLSLNGSNYYCSLVILDDVNSITTTIFSMSDGKIYIK